MNVYINGTGDYLLISVTKKSGPGSASSKSITSGVSASIVPTGTAYGSFTATSFANGFPAVDISNLGVGTYDCYVKITDPDNPGRFPIELAGSFQIK